MAKPDLKTLMMNKGERIALYAAGGIMLLLMIVGVLNLSSTPDTEKLVKDVEQGASNVKSVVNGNQVKIEELPKWVMTVYKLDPYKMKWTDNLFFDPIAPADKRAINPTVLAISDIQADFMHAKILAYDIDEGADGKLKIGVLEHRPAKGDKIDKDNAKGVIKDIGGKFVSPKSAPKQGGVGVNNPKGGATKAPVVDSGPRYEVEYVPLDAESLVGKRLAWTIYPQRMVIIHAEFPYKKQIEEIKNALRLNSPDDVFGVDLPDNDTPYFRGYVIQRQIQFPDGKVEDWHDLSVLENYRSTIYTRKIRDLPNDPNLLYVMLNHRHKLTMPLPVLLSGKYPEMKLKGVQDSIEKLKLANKPPEHQRAPSRFNSEGDIFEPTMGTEAGGVGQPNIGGGEGMTKLPPPVVTKEGDPKSAGTKKFADQPDSILLRIIDNDITPGVKYTYRIKIRMQNPNWVGRNADDKPEKPQKYEKVSRPSDADVELLEGPWTELKGKVEVPPEDFMFATDPAVDLKGKTTVNLKPGQGILQFQRWLPVATIENFKEPIADWIVADVVATRGMYLGGKQFVNLPIWSSKTNAYVLRELPADKGSKSKEPRRGVIMDPTKPGPSYVVVDIEGGVRELRLPTKIITEETATEILLLDEKGNLQVRSSFVDRAATERANREKEWLSWIDRTEKPVGSTGAVKKNFD
ncbi:MAG: hypothetical protein K8T89_16220 [Planctomycetes bacterium]|nr:hypothetical protein [Planctomycetota bacterium]